MSKSETLKLVDVKSVQSCLLCFRLPESISHAGGNHITGSLKKILL
ncbi:MAG: hypothetical protein J6V99_04590 [Neisseriaceae bacterium]|nr:hypothetical protein [Neisseriaceae bacterium]